MTISSKTFTTSSSWKAIYGVTGATITLQDTGNLGNNLEIVLSSSAPSSTIQAGNVGGTMIMNQKIHTAVPDTGEFVYARRRYGSAYVVVQAAEG